MRLLKGCYGGASARACLAAEDPAAGKDVPSSGRVAGRQQPVRPRACVERQACARAFPGYNDIVIAVDV